MEIFLFYSMAESFGYALLAALDPLYQTWSLGGHYLPVTWGLTLVPKKVFGLRASLGCSLT
jgi:hypothetical protein